MDPLTFIERLAVEPVDPAILDYLQELAEDSDLDWDDFFNSCRTLGLDPHNYSGTANSAQSNNFSVHLASLGDTYVRRMEDQYFRELFKRPKSDEEDSSIEHGEVLVGFRGESPVGALWFADEPTETYSGYGYLDMLFVRGDERGKGIGAKLILDLLGHLPEGRSIATYAWSESFAFYRKLGFLDSGIQYQKEGETFSHMVLPTSYCVFWNWADGDPCSIQKYVRRLSLPKKVKGIILGQNEQLTTGELDINPFTAALYTAAKVPHKLLER